MTKTSASPKPSVRTHTETAGLSNGGSRLRARANKKDAPANRRTMTSQIRPWPPSHGRRLRASPALGGVPRPSCEVADPVADTWIDSQRPQIVLAQAPVESAVGASELSHSPADHPAPIQVRPAHVLPCHVRPDHA